MADPAATLAPSSTPGVADADTKGADDTVSVAKSIYSRASNKSRRSGGGGGSAGGSGGKADSPRTQASGAQQTPRDGDKTERSGITSKSPTTARSDKTEKTAVDLEADTLLGRRRAAAAKKQAERLSKFRNAVDRRKDEEEKKKIARKETRERRLMAHEDERVIVLRIKDWRWTRLVGAYKQQVAVQQQIKREARMARDAIREEGFEYEYGMLLDFRRWIAAPSRVRILRAHEGPVFDCDVSPNGSLVATCSGDSSVRLWQPITGKCNNVLVGHRGWVKSVRFSHRLRSGEAGIPRKILTASTDSTIRIWNTVTGQTIRVLCGHADVVFDAQWSPNDRRVVSCSQDRTVRVWRVSSARCLWVYRGHVDAVSSVDWSPCGNFIVSAGGYADRSVRVWDAHIYDTRHAMKAKLHTAATPQAQQDPTSGGDDTDDGGGSTDSDDDGPLLAAIASGAGDGTSVAHSVPTTASVGRGSGLLFICGHNEGTEKSVLYVHSDWVNQVIVSPNSKYIASASSDGTAKIWDAQTGACLSTVPPSPKPVLGVAFSPNGRYVAVTAVDQSIRLFWLKRLLTPVVPYPQRLATALDATLAVIRKEQEAAAAAAAAAAAEAERNKFVYFKTHTDIEPTIPAPVLVDPELQSAPVVESKTEPPPETKANDAADAPKAASKPAKASTASEPAAKNAAAVASVPSDTAIVPSKPASKQSRQKDPKIVDSSSDATELALPTSSAKDGPDSDEDYEPGLEDLKTMKQILRGHVDVVYRLRFFADGLKVVTASHDMTAIVWQLQPLVPDAPPRPRVVNSRTEKKIVSRDDALALVAVITATAAKSDVAVLSVRDIRFPDFDDDVDDAPVGMGRRGLAQRADHGAKTGEVSTNPKIPDRRPAHDHHKPWPEPQPRAVAASVLLVWADPLAHGAEIEEYFIQGRRGKYGPWVNIGVAPPKPNTWLCGLRPGASYQFRVAARNAVGAGAWSGASTLVELPPNAPAAPERPKVHQVLPTAMWLRIVWEPQFSHGRPVTEFVIQAKGGDTWRNFDDSPPLKVSWNTAFQYGKGVLTADAESAAQKRYETDPALAALRRGRLNVQRRLADERTKQAVIRLSKQEALRRAGLKPRKYRASSVVSGDIGDYDTKPRQRTEAERKAARLAMPLEGTYKEPIHLAFLYEGLRPGEQYQFRIKAINDEGQSVYSPASLSTYAQSIVPDAPGAPTIEHATPTTALVRWVEPHTNGAPATGFQIHVAGRGVKVGREKRFHAVPGLWAGRVYAFAVSACNMHGWGKPSPVSETVRLPIAPPEAPSGVHTTRATHTTVTVQWVAPADSHGSRIVGYSIKWRVEGSPHDFGAHDCVEEFDLDECELVEGSLRVDEEGAPKPVVDPATYPYSYEARMGRHLDNMRMYAGVDLAAWRLLDGIIPDSELEPEPVDLVGLDRDHVIHPFKTYLNHDMKARPKPPSHRATVGQLYALTPYEFTVTAISDEGDGEMSTPSAVVTTLAPAAPEAPPGVPVWQEPSPQMLVVEWQEPDDCGSDIVRYWVAWADPEAGPELEHISEVAVSGDVLWVELVGLKAEMQHVFQVCAENAEGRGPWSEWSDAWIMRV